MRNKKTKQTQHAVHTEQRAYEKDFAHCKDVVKTLRYFDSKQGPACHFLLVLFDPEARQPNMAVHSSLNMQNVANLLEALLSNTREQIQATQEQPQGA